MKLGWNVKVGDHDSTRALKQYPYTVLRPDTILPAIAAIAARHRTHQFLSFKPITDFDRQESG